MNKKISCCKKCRGNKKQFYHCQNVACDCHKQVASTGKENPDFLVSTPFFDPPSPMNKKDGANLNKTPQQNLNSLKKLSKIMATPSPKEWEEVVKEIIEVLPNIPGKHLYLTEKLLKTRQEARNQTLQEVIGIVDEELRQQIEFSLTRPQLITLNNLNKGMLARLQKLLK